MRKRLTVLLTATACLGGPVAVAATPAPVRTGKPAFFHRPAFQEGDSFALPIRASRSSSSAQVLVRFRLAKNTTRIPAARGKVSASFKISVDKSGEFQVVSPQRNFKPFVTVYPSPFLIGAQSEPPARTTYIEVAARRDVRVGRSFKFAFSVEVLQAGKRIGGMRAGAVCTHVASGRPGGSTRCAKSGFAARA